MLGHAREWGVVIETTFETETSLIAFGSRSAGPFESQAVVLKVSKREGDEWRSGEILQAFDGNGVARVYQHAPGAVLLERLKPGKSLAELAFGGRDEEATNILADIIEQMSMSVGEASTAHATVLTLWEWAKAFERYTATPRGLQTAPLATAADKVPEQLVESAHRLYLRLCASQRDPRLLHGDLQHYNVLFDSERGWLAIDPKGVIGEVEYEIGAILRNPIEQPELFISRVSIERRIKQLTGKLNLNGERVLAWAFAQAVLSVLWDVEDGFAVDAMHPALRLALAIQPMLPSTFDVE